MAHIYTSPQYNNIKTRLNRRKIIPLIISLSVSVLSILIYLSLSEYCYTTFISEYGTTYLPVILDLNPGIIESAAVILLTDLRIILYIAFTLSLFHVLIGSLKLIFPKRDVGKLFSLIAYSTFCVYLFHRIFLIIYTEILMDTFALTIYERLEFDTVLLFVPFIFLFSYLIQKLSDWILKLPSKLKSKRILD